MANKPREALSLIRQYFELPKGKQPPDLEKVTRGMSVALGCDGSIGPNLAQCPGIVDTIILFNRVNGGVDIPISACSLCLREGKFDWADTDPDIIPGSVRRLSAIDYVAGNF